MIAALACSSVSGAGPEPVHVIELRRDVPALHVATGRAQHRRARREVLHDDVEHRGGRLVHPLHVLEEDQRLGRAAPGRGRSRAPRARARGGTRARAPRSRASRAGRRRTASPAAAATAAAPGTSRDDVSSRAAMSASAAVSGSPSRSCTSHQNGVYGVVASYGSHAMVNVGISPARRRSSSTSRLLPMPASPATSMTVPWPVRIASIASMKQPTSRVAADERQARRRRARAPACVARPRTPAPGAACPSRRRARAIRSRTGCGSARARRSSRGSGPARRGP